MLHELKWSRRRLIAATLATAVAAPAILRSRPALAAAEMIGPQRWLELFNTHTGETVSVAYHDGRRLVAGAVAKLERVLRDHRANEVHAIDPDLYDQLSAVALESGRDARFEVISGYRSPHSNAKLASASSGVAKRSLHMQGRAVDVRLKGASCASVRDIALAMARGGVGFYRKSDFVHLDTGRVRSWQG